MAKIPGQRAGYVEGFFRPGGGFAPASPAGPAPSHIRDKSNRLPLTYPARPAALMSLRAAA